jgi:hypothetical protein
VSAARQREERARSIREARAAEVYKSLRGTPFESLLEGLPGLQEILSKIRREHPIESFREHSERARRELAKRKEMISARDARNASRHKVMRLASYADRYVALEKQGTRQVELVTFIRASGPRAALHEAARELGLSTTVMWNRFSTAVGKAKQSAGSRRVPQAVRAAAPPPAGRFAAASPLEAASERLSVLFQPRPGEIAAERRMRYVVVAREITQRFRYAAFSPAARRRIRASSTVSRVEASEKRILA